ncbi:MAG: VOC family protein [Pseudomonadota bacterium]
MITALDHFVLICPDLKAGADVYEALLGIPPDWVSAEQDGAATALFRVQNTALELLAPAGDGPVGDRVREMLSTKGPQLTSLAFRSDEIETDHRSLVRRGFRPSDIVEGSSTHERTDERRIWKRFRGADDVCGGVKTFVLQHGEPPATKTEISADSVHALDHIVISTPNPDRAIAHYGARLGLDFRLDRTAQQWNTRFLFFRTGGLTFEVIHRLDQSPPPDSDDSIWGLTWAVDNLERAHARVSGLGVDVSEVRQGRKPGSQVFTVRDGTLGVPTLFIAHEPR